MTQPVLPADSHGDSTGGGTARAGGPRGGSRMESGRPSDRRQLLPPGRGGEAPQALRCVTCRQTRLQALRCP